MRGALANVALDLIPGGKKAGKAASGISKLGKLTSVGERTWRSTAGLMYGPDKRFGNRVIHVLTHTDRYAHLVAPGKSLHSLFGVAPNQVLGLLDEAWLRRKKFGYLDKSGAWVVNMGRVIGRKGERNIVLPVGKGRRVRTGYPSF